MFIHWLILLISLLFVIINAKQSSITVSEHGINDIMNKDSSNQSLIATTQKILIRVTRFNEKMRQSITNDHNLQTTIEKRQASEFISDIIEAMEDFASVDGVLTSERKKAVPIVLVVLFLCIICCIITTICVCIKCCCCCCGSKKNRKRNQGFVAVPQSVLVHTNSPNYQQQYARQQGSMQSWNSERHSMLPQPSAPLQPIDDYLTERPPPYEKVCSSR